ncbi:hypothetical protein STAQ_39130 [Allostella sp. ATCC 35155]|nr:hypothetical protein STAQ_39130 [Stella sp. ATCC 35155]
MRDRSSIATLRATRRVWAVGTIHGEAARLERVHDLIWPRLALGDRIVYLGNHLGHGPAVRRTVDELIRFRREVIARPGFFAADVVHLRGAQEEMWQKLLQIQFALNPREVLAWMLRQGVAATIAAYGSEEEQGLAAARDGVRSLMRWTAALRTQIQAADGHSALATSLRHAAVTDDGNLLFVSADVAPDRPLHAQGDVLWWGTGAGIDSLDDSFSGCRLVVAGYDRRGRGVRIGAHAAILDAGAGQGGPVVAACFSTTGELVERLEA